MKVFACDGMACHNKAMANQTSDEAFLTDTLCVSHNEIELLVTRQAQPRPLHSDNNARGAVSDMSRICHVAKRISLMEWCTKALNNALD